MRTRVSRKCSSSNPTRPARRPTRTSRGSSCRRSRPRRRARVRAQKESFMAEQKKKETRPTKPEGGDDAAGANPEVAKKGKKIKEDLDNLLDEIDDILEENAEEFVKSYVQRGGQ